MPKNVQPELDLFSTAKERVAPKEHITKGCSLEDFMQSLQMMAEEIVRERDLPQRGVIVTENWGKAGGANEGKIVSYSICINEPAYPAAEEELSDGKRTRNPCVTFRTKTGQGAVEISLRTAVLERLELPAGTQLLPQTKSEKENDSQRISIPVDAGGLVDFLRQVVELKLKYYKSAFASSFGCCSLFEECSDAKRCTHPNRLYSTACAYRRNLEQWRIFYGRNRNV